jgi:carbohydrate diacid regulator
MMQINEILSKLHTILKCKIALLKDAKLYFYPAEAAGTIEEQQLLQDYSAWNIEAADSRVIFYTESSALINEDLLKLAVLYIKDHLGTVASIHDSINRLLSGGYNHSDVTVVDQLIKKEDDLHLIVIIGTDFDGTEKELYEIIKNSVNTKNITGYQGNLIILVQEQNIYEACSDLQKNILTELYVETIIIIGDILEQPQQLAKLYDSCVEASLLKQSYGINERLLDYRSMMIYRFIASIDQELKNQIIDRVFSNKFIEFLNSEIELTIEEMFKNNLNLTDTSARLYIHRNTLLYRIEKIHKLTGFDLRKFEDSMIFKLAWLMYKEN